jgi:hypothetical protein
MAMVFHKKQKLMLIHSSPEDGHGLSQKTKIDVNTFFHLKMAMVFHKKQKLMLIHSSPEDGHGLSQKKN